SGCRPGRSGAGGIQGTFRCGARRGRAAERAVRSGLAITGPIGSRIATPIRRAKAMPHKSAVLVAETSKDNAADAPLVQLLQKQVANGFILYANYKHYHWQTFGPLFRDLHRLFDEFATATLATIDEFAERIRMIGPDPIFSLHQVMETSSVD